jgi:hypothetical protein
MGNCCSTAYGEDAFAKSKELPDEKKDTAQGLQNNNTLGQYQKTKDKQAHAREFKDRDKSNN